MTKNDKPLIYIAESSLVVQKMLCTELEKLDYQVEVFTDGFAVLKAIVEKNPDLIIADADLELIDGVALCNILKRGSPKSGVPFIMIYSDGKIFDFWHDASIANKTIAVSPQNIVMLTDAVNDLINIKYISEDSFSDNSTGEKSDTENSSCKELSSWIVNAMNVSESFLNMSRNVISLYDSIDDLNLLVEKIFRMLYKVCEFDVVTLIIDAQNSKVFRSGTEFFTQSVANEFWNICKTEYEQKIKRNHTITYDEVQISGVVNAIGGSCAVQSDNQSEIKLESYHAFEIWSESELVGTIHFASTRKKIFNYSVQSSIDYVLPALANILRESLQRSELVLQKSKLRKAFSKFVPEEVIGDFLNSDETQELKNKNEKRNVVVLMSDIRNFTSISEINKPEDVVNFLNTYFTQMVDIVKKYGGTVDKFVGDAIMVLFGAPISYNDNAKRAVCAALEMYSQLENIPLGQLKFPEGIKFDIGIGIHYGDVIVGQIGSADKTNYTVIGDTVNLASRLEGLTKLYGVKVIISEAVRDELDDTMNVLLIDSVKVKGKKEAAFIYRVDEKPLPKDFTDLYEKGFKSYNEGAFSLAIPYFEKAIQIMPQDKATKLMLERCNEFAVNKPKDWDGAIALTSK